MQEQKRGSGEYLYSLETSKLPSRGVGYEVAKINARAISVKEAKVLVTLLSANKPDSYAVALAFNNIIGNCIDYDYKKIPYGDKLYLLMWLRVNTLGATFLANLTCGNCKQLSDNMPIDLTKLKTMQINKEYKGVGTVKFEDGNKEEHTFDLSLFTLGDEEAVISMARANNMTDDEEVFARYAASIRAIDGKPVTLAEAIEFLVTLPEGSKPIQIIKKFFEYFDCGMSLEYEVICPACGGASTVLIPFRASLFIAPEISDDDFRGAIVFK